LVIQYDGLEFEVPELEPPQNRSLDDLHPIFRQQLESYVSFAQRYTPHELRIGETRRSLERQVWLFSQGRVNTERIRSWTVASKHRSGLAADLYMVDRVTGQAVWDTEVWRAMYELAPPAWYGLTTISKEYVHLESVAADQMIARATELGVVTT
jgi:hypothetical protein